jgi:hypothetical protein
MLAHTPHKPARLTRGVRSRSLGVAVLGFRDRGAQLCMVLHDRDLSFIVPGGGTD